MHTSKNKYFKKMILYLVTFIAFLVLLGLSPLFTINKVEVYGNKHYKNEDIVGITNLIEGKNWFHTINCSIKDILSFRYHDAEKSILRDRSYIKEVETKYIISKKTVIINIVEREPLAIIPYLGTNLLVDSRGVVMDALNNREGYKLPIIRGLIIDNYELGKNLYANNSKNIDVAFNICSSIHEADADEKTKLYNIINYIDISDLAKVCMVIDSRILVNLGDYVDFNDYKIDFLKEVYFGRLKKEDKGVLEFTSDQNIRFTPYYLEVTQS